MICMDSTPNTRFSDGPSNGPLELLEAELVVLEPALDGFFGAIVELYERRSQGRGTSPRAGGERFVVRQTASGSGNLLTSFATDDEETAYRVFANIRAHGHLSDEPWVSPVEG